MANANLPDNWSVFNDAEQLAQSLVEEILQLAEQAIAERGAFRFITAGGTTPNRCYQLLAERQADWQNWHIYMGDERVLPFVNPERNSQALLNNWLSINDIPVGNIHFINTEAGAEKSAQLYADLIGSIESFDVCLLGMGEDGHTASLFPGHEESETVQGVLPGLVNTEHETGGANTHAEVIIETDSPKAPAERVSLNYPAFQKCQRVFKLITGQGKREAIAQWLIEEKPLPIKKVQGQNTQVYISQDALPE